MTSTDTNLQNIIDKIAKLQTLASNAGATPGEAANAAAKVQELLFEHNLTMAEVRAKTSGAPPKYGKHQVNMKSQHSNPWLTAWKTMLLSYTAHFNWCTVIIHNNTSMSTIVGTAENAEIVHQLYSYLEKEMLRQVKLAMRAYRERRLYANADDIGHFRYSFLMEAVMAIARRLKDIQEVQIASHATAGALVVQTARELEEAVSNLFPHIRPNEDKLPPTEHYAGMTAGMQAGKNVRLQSEVKR